MLASAPSRWIHPKSPHREPGSFAFIPLDGKAEYWEAPDLNSWTANSTSAVFSPSRGCSGVSGTPSHAHGAGGEPSTKLCGLGALAQVLGVCRGDGSSWGGEKGRWVGVSWPGLLALHKKDFDNSIGVSWGGSAHGRRGQQGFAFPFPKAPGVRCWGGCAGGWCQQDDPAPAQHRVQNPAPPATPCLQGRGRVSWLLPIPDCCSSASACAAY